MKNIFAKRRKSSFVFSICSNSIFYSITHNHSRELTHERCVNWPVTSFLVEPGDSHLLAHLFAKPKTRPLKFNKCPSNLKRESEQTRERTQPTSNLYYVH